MEVCKRRLHKALEKQAGKDEHAVSKAELIDIINSSKEVPAYCKGDGSADLKAWEESNKEIDILQRPPVLIECDVRLLDWMRLAKIQYTRYKKLFDVIIMDPPWQARLNLKYPVLSDEEIMSIPLNLLQTVGYVMMWIIDMKEEAIKAAMKVKGYEYKVKITWAKVTKNGIPVNGSGVTTRHSTETLYIFSKGEVGKISRFHKMNDLIVSQVTGESEKPLSLYERIRLLVEHGFFLEIFARMRNIQPNTVCIGNMLRQ